MSKKRKILIIILCIVELLIIGGIVFYLINDNKNDETIEEEIKETKNETNSNVYHDEEESYDDIISNCVVIDEIGDYRLVIFDNKYSYWGVDYTSKILYILDDKNKKIIDTIYFGDLLLNTNITIQNSDYGSKDLYNPSECLLTNVEIKDTDDRLYRYTKENLSKCKYYIIGDDYSDKAIYVNKEKNVITTSSYDYLIGSDKNLIVLYDGKYFVVSKDVGDYDESIYKYGLLDINTLKPVIEVKYDDLYYLTKNKYVAKLNEKYGLIDANNKLLMNLEYDSITLTNTGDKNIIVAKKNKNITLFDENLKDITNEVNKEDLAYSVYYEEYKKSDNGVGDLDLYFLKEENKKENKIYSPLSIKFVLEMLNEAADGETKTQIESVLKDYYTGKYDNNSNMSVVNALFIKDTFKNSIKDSYIKTISSKYNANVIYDSFKTSDNVNKWVKQKTFNLIDNAVDVSDKNFILLNALAINMEWINKIQKEYSVGFNHIDFYTSVGPYVGEEGDDPYPAEINAVINKYDIVNVLGKDKIRETVKKAYSEWRNSPDSYPCKDSMDEEPDVDTYIKETITDEYFEEMDKAYNHYSSSTDFMFFDDKDVKVFAKDLKTYNGITLQYVGIMPKGKELDKYISNVTPNDINNLINNLKSIDLNNFKEGVITYIYGWIPMFDFDYKLDLMKNLNKLGIKDVFDSDKANLSKLTDEKQYINEAIHKTTINFSNDGIKAAAITEFGGEGGGDCGFYYNFEPPIEKIDLTFDKPYMFIIRDKNTGEVWFTGTVYEPTSDMTTDWDKFDFLGGN